jgi:hypothetical protein
MLIYKYQIFSLICRFCEVMPDIAQQLAITGQIYLKINMDINVHIIKISWLNLNQSSQKTT